MNKYLIVTFLQEILDWSFVQGMPLGMPMALISTGGGTVVTLDLGSQFSLANSYKEVSFATPKIASDCKVLRGFVFSCSCRNLAATCSATVAPLGSDSLARTRWLLSGCLPHGAGAIHSWIFYLLMCFPVFLQWTFSSLRIHIFMCFRCVLPEYSFAQILVEHRASETISVTAENMDLPIWHYASSIKEISSNFNYAFSIHTFC